MAPATSTASIQPLPTDSTPLRQGSRIYIEELSPEQLQHLGQPELPIRLTISGIVPDPTGERPPPVLELRFDRGMLADIKQQIQPLGPAPVQEADQAPEESVQPQLARRNPGQWLHEKLKPEENAERRGTWNGLGAPGDKVQLVRDALRRPEAMT